MERPGREKDPLPGFFSRLVKRARSQMVRVSADRSGREWIFRIPMAAIDEWHRIGPHPGRAPEIPGKSKEPAPPGGQLIFDSSDIAYLYNGKIPDMRIIMARSYINMRYPPATVGLV